MTNRPLIMLAFGGSFTAGIRQSPDIVRLCNEFARRGYVCASIDYRLTSSPPTRTDAILAVVRAVHDAKAAVRFMRRSVAEEGNPYGIDSSQIFFGGVSAGGFIALHLAFMNSAEKFAEYNDTTGYDAEGGLEGLSGNLGYSSQIHGVINLCGAIGDATWIEPGGQFIISAHGTNDRTVPYGTAEITALGRHGIFVDGSFVIDSVAKRLGIFSQLYTYVGLDHVPFIRLDPIEILLRGLFDEQLMDSTVKFIAKHLYSQINCNALRVVEPDSRNTAAEALSLSARPNPANQMLTIQMPISWVGQPVQLRMRDLAGRTVFETAVWQTDGVWSLPRGDWANGLYAIELRHVATGARQTLRVLWE
jgi:hypothetical protein